MIAAFALACTLSMTLPAYVPETCFRLSSVPETSLDSVLVEGERPDCCTWPRRIVARFSVRGLEGRHTSLIFAAPFSPMQFRVLTKDRAGNEACEWSRQVAWRAR